MDDKWNQGRFGYGTPDYNSNSWQLGDSQRRFEEGRQRQEAESKASRERIEAGNRAFSEGLKTATASPSFYASSPATTGSSFANGPFAQSNSTPSSYRAHAYVYSPPTFFERVWWLVTAPFRWVWRLLALVFRAGVWLLKVAAALAVVAVVIALLQPRKPDAAGAPATPWFGVGLEDVSAENTAILHLAPGAAAYVGSVAPNSPAWQASLAPGDVIYAVAGRGVKGANGTVGALDATPIGVPVAIDFIRRGQTFRVMAVPTRLAR